MHNAARWSTLLLLAMMLLMTCSLVMAKTTIKVLALGRNMAVISIDGKRYVLGRGQTTLQGISLLHANSERAILLHNGKRKVLTLGMVGTIEGPSIKSTTQQTVALQQDSQGMYRIKGSINGKAVAFLLDTGASSIALSSERANRLGIDYKKFGRKVPIHTASGQAEGYQITLNQVMIGHIKLHNIQALVIEGNAPYFILLGMSALKQLQMEHKGSVLYLKKKW